jgi:hypothetical protein
MTGSKILTPSEQAAEEYAIEERVLELAEIMSFEVALGKISPREFHISMYKAGMNDERSRAKGLVEAVEKWIASMGSNMGREYLKKVQAELTRYRGSP